MKKTLFIICLSVACTTIASTQRSDSLDLEYEFYKRSALIDLSGGGRFDFYNFDDLNGMLRQANLPELGTTGYGGFFALRTPSATSRWVGEFSFDATSSRSNDGNAINGAAVVYRDFSLRLRVLYHVSDPANLTKLYPFAGLGNTYRSLNTYSNIPGNGSFVSTVNQDVRRYNFSNSSIPLEIGLGLEQGFRGKSGDFFIGVRGGYTYNVLSSDWTLDGDVLTDLSKPGAGVPFAAFLLRFKSDPKRAWEARKKKAPAQE
ncbi:MAG: hypothetical protein KF734_01340 [Saprospiraceae bacterium]|nr:hypothetical protein [Saprospiraceae bacterium]